MGTAKQTVTTFDGVRAGRGCGRGGGNDPGHCAVRIGASFRASVGVMVRISVSISVRVIVAAHQRGCAPCVAAAC